MTSQHVHQDDIKPTAKRSFKSSRAPGSGFFVMMDGWKKACSKDIIDLSVGASDLPAPSEPLETLRAATYDPSTYSYCLKHGTSELRNAACQWYKRRFGVDYDPNTECLTLIGSQEGLAHLLLGVTEHGDSILMCNVAYASYWGALQVAGLSPRFLTTNPETRLPDFKQIQPEQLHRTKVLLLNYPNNPTTVTATDEFFQEAIDFCKQHGLLLIHDNPYVDQVYEGRAPSPLSLPGGRDCCVEIFSFAKSHHIAGFRLGFALGNADAIEALEAVKAPIDFNQYKGIQLMGVTCLSLPEERVRADAQIWKRRAVTMVEALKTEAGWHIELPKSGMYLWSPLPRTSNGGSKHDHDDSNQQPNGGSNCQLFNGDDVQFCKELLAATGVSISPGSGFGPGGAGYVRFALVADEQKLQEAARRIGTWLRSYSTC